jgi:hypothetical protein
VTDRELDTLHKTVADGIVKLRQQSEIGTGGRARILFYALAMYLDERGIIDHLGAEANYAAQSKALRETDIEQKSNRGQTRRRPPGCSRCVWAASITKE